MGYPCCFARQEVAQVSASLEQLQKAMLEKVAIVSELNKTALAAQQRADSLRVAAARQVISAPL